MRVLRAGRFTILQASSVQKFLVFCSTAPVDPAPGGEERSRQTTLRPAWAGASNPVEVASSSSRETEDTDAPWEWRQLVPVGRGLGGKPGVWKRALDVVAVAERGSASASPTRCRCGGGNTQREATDESTDHSQVELRAPCTATISPFAISYNGPSHSSQWHSDDSRVGKASRYPPPARRYDYPPATNSCSRLPSSVYPVAPSAIYPAAHQSFTPQNLEQPFTYQHLWQQSFALMHPHPQPIPPHPHSPPLSWGHTQQYVVPDRQQPPQPNHPSSLNPFQQVSVSRGPSFAVHPRPQLAIELGASRLGRGPPSGSIATHRRIRTTYRGPFGRGFKYKDIPSSTGTSPHTGSGPEASPPAFYARDGALAEALTRDFWPSTNPVRNTIFCDDHAELSGLYSFPRRRSRQRGLSSLILASRRDYDANMDGILVKVAPNLLSRISPIPLTSSAQSKRQHILSSSQSRYVPRANVGFVFTATDALIAEAVAQRQTPRSEVSVSGLAYQLVHGGDGTSDGHPEASFLSLLLGALHRNVQRRQISFGERYAVSRDIQIIGQWWSFTRAPFPSDLVAIAWLFWQPSRCRVARFPAGSVKTSKGDDG
ncbi:hypothetical protein K438DRAFT_1788719 [Mycena galopus ATCC 62051]|nr:hypothetical protein K438DRAFT_1788719 [Mycena galopus ATCC 62051]